MSSVDRDERTCYKDVHFHMSAIIFNHFRRAAARLILYDLGAWVVSTKCKRASDRQTDGRTDGPTF